MTDPRITDLQQQVDALTTALDNEKRRYAPSDAKTPEELITEDELVYLLTEYDNQRALEAEAGMAELIHQTAADSRSAGRDEAAREIWAAIRKAVDEPMGTPSFPAAYLQGRRDAVDLIRDLAEAEMRRDPPVGG